ncbi:hypothetical protein Cgig2_021072 [Carnegiea gigantea]|uniref:Uncharacterized protein n=1 Tax=Carnegiea gigantea TaxID=171969 RepID=A0A9Q1Q3W0_9CARY|nr:hypothetical protein Cgig2_021072 [Carnegiea gigantea]
MYRYNFSIMFPNKRLIFNFRLTCGDGDGDFLQPGTRNEDGDRNIFLSGEAGMGMGMGNPSCPASLSPLKPLTHLSGQASRSSHQSRLSLVHRSFNAGDQNGLDRTPAIAPALRTAASSIDLRMPTTSVQLLFGESGGILVHELGRRLSFGAGSCIYSSSATSTIVHSSTCPPTASASSSVAIGYGKVLNKDLQRSNHLPKMKKVVRLTKKGKIYGFGMEGSYASSTSPSTIKQVPIEEKQSKKKLKKKLHRVEKKSRPNHERTFPNQRTC